MAKGNATRLEALVAYAMARYGEAGGAPVLVVEEGDGGRRSVVRGLFTHPCEKDRLVAMLGVRTRFVKRWGVVVWTTAPAGAAGTAQPVRYAFCTTPDHRAGVLLAQRYAGAWPVGALHPVDRHDLAPGWRPAPLSAERSPVARIRWLLAAVSGGVGRSERRAGVVTGGS